MTRRHINIGTESQEIGFDRFINAWKQAEQNNESNAEVHLNFEDLSMLLAVITPRRLDILKTLRQRGPMSIQALSITLSRNYNNVYSDTRALRDVGLIECTESGELQAPWDIIDAHFSLVA